MLTQNSSLFAQADTQIQEETQTYFAAFGEVLDVTVASMLTARNGPGSLLGSLAELLTILFDAAQQGTSWFLGSSVSEDCRQVSW